MTILKPAPVSIYQFSYAAGTATLSAEISSTNGLGRVYDDACDDGLTVVGTSGKEVVFVVWDVTRDAEGDILHWNLRSTDGKYTMVLFND